MLLGLAGLANLAVRSLQDWVILMLAVATPHLARMLADAARHDRRRAWVARLLRLDASCKRIFGGAMMRLQPVWLGAAVAGLLMVSFIPPLSRQMPLQDAPEWPAAAVDRIAQLGLEGRFFAPPDYGSYLTWRLGKRVQVYTDTRGFFFPPVFLEDCIIVPAATEDWRRRLARVLDEYGTDYFLLETTGVRGELWRLLQTKIAEPFYLDAQTVLFSAAQLRYALAR
jgi:hypothetical protein